MEFNSLLTLVGNDPLFKSSLFLAGNISPQTVRLQLTRWVKSRRIIQLRRGLYAVAEPYQKTKPHPFYIANHLQRASYVSLQSALAYYGMIPENVNIVTSVSTGRPEKFETPFGRFVFRHVKQDYLFGYNMCDLGGQSAFVASPEKALLDLVYFQPGEVTIDYLTGLRLQNTDKLDLNALKGYMQRFGSPKMVRAIERVTWFLSDYMNRFEIL